jgi:hypothetical protein
MERRNLIPLVLLASALPVVAAVKGTIIRPDGTPVANARVAALRPIARLDWNESLPAGPETPMAVAVTDARGMFAVDVEGRGLVRLRVDADGFAPLNVIVPMDEDAGRVVLRAAPMVEGHVTAGGKPVVGAEVFVISSDGAPVRYTTDQNGIYRLPDPRVWASAILVRYADYAASVSQPAQRDVALTNGLAIDGRVVDTNDKPVGGASVVLSVLAVTTSAADGTFHFAHAPAAGGWIRARSAAGIGMAQVAGGRTTVRLQALSKISGVIRDSEKHPLAGIGVLATGMEAGDAAVTDSEGAFTLFVPRGAYGLTDAGDEIYDFQAEANTTGGDARADVVATRFPAVEGVVLDAAGHPVPVAAVSLRYTSSNGDYVRPTHVLTDEAGRFRLRFQVVSRGTVRAMVVKRGLPFGMSTPLDVKTHSIDITLPQGVALAGRVVGADGRPIAGVAVAPLVGMVSPEGIPPAPVEAWATTGDDGRFAGRMSEGSVAFAFTKEGYIGGQQAVSVVAETKPVEVTLVRAAHLAGRVVRKDGTPVADVPVAAGEISVVSAADGSFRVDGIVPGAQNLRFGADLGQQQRVTAPADDVRLVMPATRTIHGRVIDSATGSPVEAFSLILEQGAEMDGHAFESPAGEFVLELPETVATIGAAAEGYAPATKVKINPSADPLVVSLTRGRVVRGHVTDEKGQPLSGVSLGEGVEFQERGENLRKSGDDGTYEVTGLSLETDVVLEFHKDGFVRTQQRVKAGRDDVTVDVTLRRGVSVSGRVIDRSGTGVAEVEVTAVSAAQGAQQVLARTGEGGEFRFDALDQARWDFNAARDDKLERGAVKDVDVEKVHELTITLDALPAATIFGHVSGLDPAWTIRYVTANNLDGASKTTSIDAAGDYRIENAPAGIVDVSAVAGAQGINRQAKSGSAEVAAGSELRVDLAFVPQVGVHGRVTRGSAPLEGATVRFGYSPAQQAMTGAGGVYSLQVDPGEYDATIVAGDRELPFSQQVVVTGPAEVNLAVDVATITAMVVDDAGRPLAGAKVTAAPHGRTHSAAESVTGPDGTAVLEVGGGETDTIVAALQGYGNASQDVAANGVSSVTLHMVRSAGAVVRIVDVRDGRTLSGYAIARDAAGRVIASASEPEPDGTMLLPVPPGTYRFSASAENYGSQTIRSDVPATGEIRVPLPRGGSLALRSRGDLHATAALIQPNGEEYVRCWCNGVADITVSGRSTLVDQIAPGTYTLEVTPTGGKARKYPVTVQEGVTTTVNID